MKKDYIIPTIFLPDLKVEEVIKLALKQIK